MASKTMRVLNIVSGVLLIYRFRCAFDFNWYLLLVQSGHCSSNGRFDGRHFYVGFGHYRDRCVCRNEQAADWLRLAVAGRCADSNFVTVPAVQ